MFSGRGGPVGHSCDSFEVKLGIPKGLQPGEVHNNMLLMSASCRVEWGARKRLDSCPLFCLCLWLVYWSLHSTGAADGANSVVSEILSCILGIGHVDECA